MRGEIIYKILDFLEDRSIDTADFLTAILKSGYGASMTKIDREYNIARQKSYSYQIKRERKRDLQKYIYKLKREGLIKENSKKQVALSDKGKNKLLLLNRQRILSKNFYQNQAGDKVIIVSYDIPLPFNKERAILRDILKVLGFSIIHKSVWVGKVKIPPDFIIAIEKFLIIKFIEILEVTKSGSLNNLKK